MTLRIWSFYINSTCSSHRTGPWYIAVNPLVTHWFLYWAMSQISAPVNWSLSFHQCSCWKKNGKWDILLYHHLLSRNNDLFHGIISLFLELNSFVIDDNSCHVQQDAMEVRGLETFMVFYNFHLSSSNISLTLDYLMSRPSYPLNTFCAFFWISFSDTLANQSVFCPSGLIYSDLLFI